MVDPPDDPRVGVDDPYEHVEVCDHVTDDGRCRFAFEHPEQDPEFARERRGAEFRCPVVSEDGDGEWAECPHFRSRATDRECVRCGLEERRMAHSDDRPLLEEHHLSYADGQSPSSNRNALRSGDANDGENLGHEITVYLCRWCHAKVHKSWARLDDDVGPDPEALAETEGRRSQELAEMDFETAAERFDDGE
ncbi:hypothetical protein BRC81_12760 [Halobacteriales archaeon QS_1_68_20]|nr:MAG: hypothetical protein BRC81_12760 [Halobacteriales archaeon QS_1_68_20]